MDAKQSVQELLRGIGAAHLCVGVEKIDFSLIERLKKEVDLQVQSDIQQAFKLAEVVYTLSLRIDDPQARALGLRARAQAHYYSSRYEEAIEFWRQAAEIYRSQEKHVEAARMARSMIDPMILLGRYDEALALADNAREMLIAHDEKILLAQLETNVGNLYFRIGQDRQALECYQRAREVFAEANDRKALAIVVPNIANIYTRLDDFRRSQELYQWAFELACEQQMELAAAQIKYNLGYLHFLKGEYHQALRQWHDGLGRFVRLGDERLVALCHLDLAEAYLQLNVPDEAAQMAIEARERFQKLACPYESAKALTWLGLAYLHQSKLVESEQALLEAQEEFRKEGNEVYLGLLKLFLAELYLKRNEPKAAITIATEAQELFSGLGLKAKTCSAQFVVAAVLMAEGANREARELCEGIIPVSETLDAPWIKYQAQELLGDILMTESEPQKAYKHYVNAAGLVEMIRARIRVDEFRGAFFKGKLRVYEQLIRICLGQRTAEKIAEAFYYLESRKARTLIDLLVNELEVTPSSKNPSISGLRERWKKLREELNWFYSQRESAETVLDVRHQSLDPTVMREISVREKALAELVREAQLQDSDFGWLRGESGLTVAELRSVLSPDETVIEYYFDGDALNIFVIDQESIEVVQSLICRQELDDLVLELDYQFETFRYGQAYVESQLDKLQKSTKACLHDFYVALFAPIAHLIGEGKRRKLIFITFDLLHNVPFHALYDGEKYLLDAYEIAFAPSARLLVHCARKPARPSWGDSVRALILGIADTIAPKISEEIEAIRESFPSANCFTGSDAQLSALVEHLPESDIVHIACHGGFRDDNPMFSSLRLAGQWLTYYDICSLRIPSSLVTLSGCSTGVNSIHGEDEMYGLVSGFLTAGASSLVASLWTVNDTATAKLMTLFYRQLKEGSPPLTALRSAVLQIKSQSPHPYYWAPFIFIGHSSTSDSPLSQLKVSSHILQ
jgi:CHAT domain-containing protein/tetratricopeptide (TPR) repeat protein